MRARVTAGTALAAALLLVAGCGAGSGPQPTGAILRVTADHGHRLLAKSRERKIPDGQTVAQLMAAKGVRGVAPNSFWVNGVRPPGAAGDTKVHDGDVIQADTAAAPDTEAIVGSFAQPFVSGTEGKKLPVRLECQDPGGAACSRVKTALSAVGVLASGSSLGAPGNQKILRVVIAKWDRARRLPRVRALEDADSGAYARFADGGKVLDLLGPDGATARRAAPGEGLLAALHPTDTEYIWVVTGLDDAAVQHAAEALGSSRMDDAIAVAAGSAAITKLPVRP